MVIRSEKNVFEKTPKNGSRSRTGLLEQQPGLIQEICGYLAQGATDTCVCRIIGINPVTMSTWKTKGKEHNGDIYETFYMEYQRSRGHRELAWLKDIDGKWMLTHHPDTKNDYAEMRYQKQEFSMSAIEEEARKSEMQKKIDEGLKNLEFQIDSPQRIDDVPEEAYAEDKKDAVQKDE